MATATATKRGRGRPKLVDGTVTVGLPQSMLDLIKEASAVTGTPEAQLMREAITASTGRFRHAIAVAKAEVQRAEHAGACNGPKFCVCTCPMCNSHTMEA